MTEKRQVSPQEVEAIRLFHESVVESSAYSLPSEKLLARQGLALCDTCDALREGLRPLAEIANDPPDRTHDYSDDELIGVRMRFLRRAAELVKGE